MSKGFTTQEYIPQGIEDLYITYFLPVDGLVQQTIRSRSRGKIQGDDVLDVAHTIIAKFKEYNLLARFDKTRATSFKSFLYNIVCTNVYDELRRLAKTDDTIDLTQDVVVSDEDNDTRMKRHLLAVDAVAETKVEWNQTIKAMQDCVNRAARLNRHKRDKSLRMVLELVRENETLERIAQKVGVTISTIRNYIGYIALGANAEINGTGSAFASESTFRPDARKEMSTKELAKLVRSKGKSLAFADSDGNVSYPHFVTDKRGWHFVTMGPDDNYDLVKLTGDTRGFKLHKSDGETVIKVRHFDETDDFLIVSETVPDTES